MPEVVSAEWGQHRMPPSPGGRRTVKDAANQNAPVEQGKGGAVEGEDTKYIDGIDGRQMDGS